MSAATPVFASSGNLFADRRYEYARAAAKDGDDAAAADLLEQALELAPDWAAAWFALGEACERQGARDQAARAFAQCIASDPDDRHGASLRLALGGGAPAPVAMGAAYVRGLFDQYAPRFDAHLTGALGYRGPQILEGALRAACDARGRGFHFAAVLDLGCGTGLMAAALDPHFDTIHGVDLSPGMIAQARKTGLYDSLETAEMLGWMKSRPAAQASLVTAADVLVYVGDLSPLFAQAARVLDPARGLFAFTTQRLEGEDYALGADMRFAHAPEYLRGCAQAAGLQVVLLEEQSTRRDAGRDVPGLVCVLELAREAAS